MHILSIQYLKSFIIHFLVHVNIELMIHQVTLTVGSNNQQAGPQNGRDGAGRRRRNDDGGHGGSPIGAGLKMI